MSFEFQTLVVLIHCFFPSPVSSLFGLKLSTVLILYIFSNTVLIGGDDSLRVTPVPIPNTEVKPLLTPMVLLRYVHKVREARKIEK